MNKLYPADNDCLSRSRSWRAKLFTGRSRRPTALVATRGAAVTLKAPEHGPHLYVSYRGEGGKTSGYYVPKAAESEVRRGVEAWQPAPNTVAAAFRPQQRARPPSRSRQKIDALLQQALVS